MSPLRWAPVQAHARWRRDGHIDGQRSSPLSFRSLASPSYSGSLFDTTHRTTDNQKG